MIKQLDGTPAAPGPDALAMAVRTLDAEYRQFRYRIATASGLSIAEFDAITTLAFASEPVTAKQISTDTHLSTGAITALLDRLTVAELVVRAPNPADRRSVVVTLSPEGRDLVQRIYHSVVHAFTPIAHQQQPQQLDAWIGMLTGLTDVVRQADSTFTS